MVNVRKDATSLTTW